MRCKYIYLVLIVLFSTSLASQNLIGHWVFEGNAGDVSGNGHHATVVQAVPVEDRFGNPDGAYYFDGIDDFMVVPDFDLGSEQMTVMAWAKPDGDLFDDYGNIVSKHTGGGGNNGVETILRINKVDYRYDNEWAIGGIQYST